MKNKYLKYFLCSAVFLFAVSCSESADDLIEKGEYDKAVVILKGELSKDYRNTGLRNKITKLYFTNATSNIEDGRLEEAERNLERGIIYSDETNPEIKDEYADILVLLGAKLIKTGDREGSVDLKKKYEKGVSLINKSVDLSGNEKGKEILSVIKKEEAQRYFDLAQVDYNGWISGSKRSLELLTESFRNLQRSMEIIPIPEAETLKNRLLEAFMSQNIKSNPYDIRFSEIFFNSDNGYTAFRIRFHNNSTRDIVVSPSQFTLYDTNEKSYKYDVVAAKKGNYKGLLESIKVNPDRFASGLLVFNTDFKKSPVMSKIVWMDDLGNTYTKFFPKAPLTGITLE
jgi:tetratricopeptide (TPR) repeat protein